MKYILDTNVYIGAFQSQEREALFRAAFFPLIPETFLSSVVAYELLVNAVGDETSELLHQFTKPMEQAGRIISPTFNNWLEASEIVTRIGTKEKNLRSKLPSLLNDILIALCARQIGATVITYNKEDFLLIRRHKEFRLRLLMN